mmetsp:Transcript_76159/g.240839  ORF Transcript_76159/g.240839 Transcript_76159/m.240839 type:complete len:426 (-) Transcript_76159:69-1346(-)
MAVCISEGIHVQEFQSGTHDACLAAGVQLLLLTDGRVGLDDLPQRAQAQVEVPQQRDGIAAERGDRDAEAARRSACEARVESLEQRTQGVLEVLRHGLLARTVHEVGPARQHVGKGPAGPLRQHCGVALGSVPGSQPGQEQLHVRVQGVRGFGADLLQKQQATGNLHDRLLSLQVLDRSLCNLLHQARKRAGLHGAPLCGQKVAQAAAGHAGLGEHVHKAGECGFHLARHQQGTPHTSLDGVADLGALAPDPPQDVGGLGRKGLVCPAEAPTRKPEGRATDDRRRVAQARVHDGPQLQDMPPARVGGPLHLEVADHLHGGEAHQRGVVVQAERDGLRDAAGADELHVRCAGSLEAKHRLPPYMDEDAALSKRQEHFKRLRAGAGQRAAAVDAQQLGVEAGGARCNALRRRTAARRAARVRQRGGG